MNRLNYTLLPAVVIACVLGLAPSSVSAENHDPWEPLNQRIFSFNKFMDDKFIRPVAQGYRNNMPRPVQRGVRNFFNNLNDVTVLMNNVLQLKLGDAANDTGRLLLNTTIGLGGFLDVATGAGLEKNNEDFGQTLGAWGIGPGPYVVLPLFGPSTLRDSFGFGVDVYTSPIHYVDDVTARNSLHALNTLDTRVEALQLDTMMFGDEYIFIREAYLQQREYLVTDGQVDDDWDDWDDWD